MASQLLSFRWLGFGMLNSTAKMLRAGGARRTAQIAAWWERKEFKV